MARANQSKESQGNQAPHWLVEALLESRGVPDSASDFRERCLYAAEVALSLRSLDDDTTPVEPNDWAANFSEARCNSNVNADGIKETNEEGSEGSHYEPPRWLLDALDESRGSADCSDTFRERCLEIVDVLPAKSPRHSANPAQKAWLLEWPIFLVRHWALPTIACGVILVFSALLLSKIGIGGRNVDFDRLYSNARKQLEHGDLRSALQSADIGLQNSEKNSIWNWKFREVNAEALIWQAHPQEALDLLNVPVPQGLSTGVFAVRGKDTQANALAKLGRRDEARKRLEEAEDMASRTAPELLCETVLYQGDLAFSQDQFLQAEELYRKSLELARRYHQPFVESTALNGLGLALIHLGRFDEGIESTSDAMRLDRSADYHLNEQIALSSRAWGYQQLGDLDKAISCFLEELKVIEGLGREQLEEDVLSHLGKIYAAQGNYSAARVMHLRALEIARRIFRETGDSYYVVEVLSNIASLDIDQGNLNEAETYSHEALGLRPRNEYALLGYGRIVAARHNSKAAKPMLQELVDRGNKFVRQDAQLELAHILAAENNNALAEHKFQNLVAAVEFDRSHLHSDENRLAFSSHARRFYDAYVRFLILTNQERKAFQVAEFSRARTLDEGLGLEAPEHPNDISIEKIQRSLRQQSKVILSYWLASDKSFVWLVSPSQFEVFTLARGGEIEKKIREYNQAIQEVDTPAEFEQQGQSLYSLLIEPVQKFIPRDAHIIIIPDGGLTKLNFETLRVPNPKPHFWIEDVELEAASSSLFIRRDKQIILTNQKALLIGDPVQVSSDYPALPHAAEELKRVESHFVSGQKITISQANATPSAYGASHPGQFGLIHFVTHGTASELSPLESAIILSSQPDNSFKLYARDIVKIPLKADIVTISACSGLGIKTYSGEGLVGLAWAFLRAGSHQVVAGLWEVDDRAAVVMMDDFYTGLQRWKSASEALRLAKLNMIQSEGNYSHPYYWASLQLYTG